MTTVNQGLDAGNHIAVNSLRLNLQAIPNRREGRVGPARAAVHGDVLVQVCGQQTLLTVIQRSGKVRRLDVGVGSGCLDLFMLSVLSVHSVILFLLCHKSTSSPAGKL